MSEPKTEKQPSGELREMTAEELLNAFWNIGTMYGRESRETLLYNPNHLRAELLRRLEAGKEQEPKCPRCGSIGIYTSIITNHFPHELTVRCADCKETWPIRDIADFAQFFPQPRKEVPTAGSTPSSGPATSPSGRRASEGEANPAATTKARQWLQTYERPIKYRTGWISTADSVNSLCTSELAEMLAAFALSQLRAAKESGHLGHKAACEANSNDALARSMRYEGGDLNSYIICPCGAWNSQDGHTQCYMCHKPLFKWCSCGFSERFGEI